MRAHTVITHAPNQGVTLSKITDRDVPGVEHAPAPVRGAWLLARNDLDLTAEWFSRALDRARRLGHL